MLSTQNFSITECNVYINKNSCTLCPTGKTTYIDKFLMIRVLQKSTIRISFESKRLYDKEKIAGVAFIHSNQYMMISQPKCMIVAVCTQHLAYCNIRKHPIFIKLFTLFLREKENCLCCIKLRYARRPKQCFHFIRMHLIGEPSAPRNRSGRQCNEYSPGMTFSNLRPSTRMISWTGSQHRKKGGLFTEISLSECLTRLLVSST
jgi:hypothetical protein